MQHHHWTLIALLAGCAPPEFHFPAVDEAECAIAAQDTYENESSTYCVRLTARDGATVRLLGTSGCDAWVECLVLAPGDTAVHGSGLANPGTVDARELECTEVEPCP